VSAAAVEQLSGGVSPTNRVLRGVKEARVIGTYGQKAQLFELKIDFRGCLPDFMALFAANFALFAAHFFGRSAFLTFKPNRGQLSFFPEL
jgi:hypothetical protein